MTPTINKDVLDFTFKLKPNIMSENKIAPKIADEIIDRLEANIPEDIKVIATNKFDPDDIPKILGPARGLLKYVCISSPAIESALPAIRTIIVLGKCSSFIIILSVEFVLNSVKFIKIHELKPPFKCKKVSSTSTIINNEINKEYCFLIV